MGVQTIDEIVRRALAEDVGSGDVTTAATVPPEATAQALITQKAPGVVFGLAVAARTFAALDPEAGIERLTEEGVWREGGEVMRVTGHAAALLTA
nr:nicotinate-nucleotide diphosphorylase (carboxylating) [Actinomycetota bacterium]